MFPSKRLAAAWLGLAAASAFAQFTATFERDWAEAEAPPPPPLRTAGLVELETPRSSLRFGVDPASVTIGQDRVVRYVVVARGTGGAVTGIYEGVHCKAGEVKVYARHNAGAGWVPVAQPRWQSLREAPHATYSLPIARQAACMGHGPNRSAADVVRDLKGPPDARFSSERH